MKHHLRNWICSSAYVVPELIGQPLTLTVRNLERDGLLVRHYFPEVPPRVEYELTEMGASMLPALEGFTSWIRENWPSIEGCRQAYDTKHELNREPGE
ncbi:MULTISPECIES: helix-turn-helix domain-containing protein [unclassified Pseudomonas]|uniref:winged helix-turn-helix transcriptional regulator n=1 Tax=unclassified Pseudomonas TaxID=196821 RepID=UPI00128D0EBD|nr:MULTISPECIES: helix-turn-helix domain-containing protein [unclassified Pseudomonas]MPQ69666.1 transcriptional regulator [Pseudomonas sp. MWU12-2323]